MSFLELHGIGKIYVSDNNVSVGIRKVDLSFEKGEFVAVTGKSGSGKSTLLNVISGMDTYEEGEMFIDGAPTSHYVQQDWEKYRQKFISFIFQDYNIIDSFTVLQNVELALMHITDKQVRRERAIELIDKVGLSSHISHKGSKLSGGQKQRTVIARALAKDSPIILADEPTGNLDSQTSQEIIKLLRDVSQDKLVIIVTHSYDQVAEYATRHIRVFDGAIEADETLSAPHQTVAEAVKTSQPDEKRKGFLSKNFLDGITLGRVRFFATPRLSAFLCILMILSSLAMTLITSLSGEALGLFEKDYIFSHRTGRTVIIRQDGAVITDDELKELAAKVGATSYVHYDFLLDMTESVEINQDYYFFNFSYVKDGSTLNLNAGRAPEKPSEIVLRVPVSLKPYFGTKDFRETTLENVFNVVDYTVVGISYYYDNTLNPDMIFSQEGYKHASSLAYYSKSKEYFTAEVTVADNLTDAQRRIMLSINNTMIHFSFDIGDSCYYIQSKNYDSIIDEFQKRKEDLEELFGKTD
ncbi:MAG TPA: ABC transporter ATP-binding protein, partial [Bacillota bacterium]|nr:ABC transporter ATP-binding protein [Bacillota bacterium]